MSAKCESALVRLCHNTLTHSAHTTHTAQPVYLYPWVDIPAFCLLVTAPSAHHTTPHHTTPHHTTYQRVYYQGILRVDVPDRKIQHGSTSDPRPPRSPTPPRPRVGDEYPGPAAGGTGRGPGDTALQGPPIYGNRHLPPGGAYGPPATCRRSGRSSGHSSAPSGSPRTRP